MKKINEAPTQQTVFTVVVYINRFGVYKKGATKTTPFCRQRDVCLIRYC